MQKLKKEKSLKTRMKISLAKKGTPSWNKGLKNIYSEETLEKMRKAKLGGKLSEEHKKKIGIKGLGNKDRLGQTWKINEEVKLKNRELAKLRRFNCIVCNEENQKKSPSQKYCQKCYNKKMVLVKRSKLDIKENRTAHNARALALKIPLEEYCQICKTEKAVERHHWRYDKALLIAHLCRTCHKIQHVKNFENSIYNREVSPFIPA